MGGSQVSMAMDLHIPNKGPVTLKVKDRSDTARRHQLLRQTKVDYVEEVDEAVKSPTGRGYSPKLSGWSRKSYPPDDEYLTSYGIIYVQVPIANTRTILCRGKETR